MFAQRTLANRLSTLTNSISKYVLKDAGLLRKLLKPAVVKILNIITLGRGIKINIGGQGTFKLSPEFFFSNWENFGGGHNSGFIPCLRASRKKNVVFDVGAHIGLFSLPLSREISGTGRIYAFEPSTLNCNYLNKHIHLNKIMNVEVFPCLLGREVKGDVPFYEDLNQVNPMGGLALVDG